VTTAFPAAANGDEDDEFTHRTERDGEPAMFDDLGDAEKVKFCEAEISSALAKLDDAIARMAAMRTEVEDPDGFVRFTLGDDGRLVELFLHDAATSSLTNLALEQKINALLDAGYKAMMLSRNEFWDTLRTD
jgi:hypothetical protein